MFGVKAAQENKFSDTECANKNQSDRIIRKLASLCESIKTLLNKKIYVDSVVKIFHFLSEPYIKVLFYCSGKDVNHVTSF